MFEEFKRDESDLNEVVERSETLRVFALVHVDERADFGRRETDVVFSEDDLKRSQVAFQHFFYLKFLSSNSVWSWPHLVIFFEDFRVFDDSLQL